uniref:Hyaluronan/mRNA-binding protein domain-containing protein n=1 Tax=Chenopodium quinoa TaxID=63459 RepID=A0A803LIG2_CHEQI
MATMNPFDLLGDNDNDDPSQLIEKASAQLQKAAAAPKKTPAQGGAQSQQQKAAKLPSKPLPPSQAGEVLIDFVAIDYSSNENAFNNTGVIGQGDRGEEGRERRPFGGPRGPFRGGRRGGFNNEEGRDGDRPRRTYERRSGTGRGQEVKREGFGRGNWGAESEEVAPGTEEAGEQNEKNLNTENLPAVEDAAEGNKEGQPEETEEKEPEEKEMTLEEYEKLLEEKRKALVALKTEERKVEVDKDLQSMQQLSNKKEDESVFIKLGSDKDKKKESLEKEKVKKSVSINEFLKPADGERFGGRGRGRGRGSRGGGYGGGGNRVYNSPAPAIEDPGEFPTLGGK